MEINGKLHNIKRIVIEEQVNVHWCKRCDWIAIVKHIGLPPGCPECKHEFITTLNGTIKEIEDRTGIKQELWELL